MTGLAIILFINDPVIKPFSSRTSKAKINTTNKIDDDLPILKQFEFPEGGRQLLPDYMLIALYGHFSAKSLGSLGEQPPEKAVERIKNIAKEYQKFTDKKIYPAFEIITTVASSSAGQDGDYSSETSVDKLKPIIKLAKENNIYIVLDLQPGHSSFLKQSKMYEELLKEPHVGLALDPEWRLLKPGQKHMVKVGSVTAEEINATADWLADLTKKYKLPQKLFLIHQFKLSMITNREKLNTSRNELAWSIQMDGLGRQEVKQDTWRNIRNNAPKGIWFGWKNFYDEDKPMLSPEQTMNIDPAPVFVSYQ